MMPQNLVSDTCQSEASRLFTITVIEASTAYVLYAAKIVESLAGCIANDRIGGASGKFLQRILLYMRFLCP